MAAATTVKAAEKIKIEAIFLKIIAIGFLLSRINLGKFSLFVQFVVIL